MIIERLIEHLEKEEGYRAEPYEDTQGLRHIGTGFNLEIEWDQEILDYLGVSDEDDITYINRQQNSFILNHHIEKVEPVVKKIYPDHEDLLSHLRAEIIIALVFQLGAGGYKKFRKHIQAVKDRNWKEAAAQLLDSRAAKQAPNRFDRISKAFETDDETFLELSKVYENPIKPIDSTQETTPLQMREQYTISGLDETQETLANIEACLLRIEKLMTSGELKVTLRNDSKQKNNRKSKNKSATNNNSGRNWL